jgi:hypothetical protein
MSDPNEYTALRATIRDRGTARVTIFVAGVAVWAALVVATAALAAPPIATIVPLVVLVATFEAVHGLHVGVERIGRYLAVFHDDQWERAAVRFGRSSARFDPLFIGPFLIAAAVNWEPMVSTLPTVQEVIFVAGAHGLFVARLVSARAAAARQRAGDEARFREIKNSDA